MNFRKIVCSSLNNDPQVRASHNYSRQNQEDSIRTGTFRQSQNRLKILNESFGSNKNID